MPRCVRLSWVGWSRWVVRLHRVFSMNVVSVLRPCVRVVSDADQASCP